MTDDPAFTVGSIRDHVDNLGAHIATWAGRSTPVGNPAERQALIEAVQDIDAAGRLLIDLRGALTAEIQSVSVTRSLALTRSQNRCR